MCRKLIYLVCFVLAMGLFGSVAQARLLVYEPFDYASIGDSVNGKSGAAIGLTGAWVTLAGGAVNEFLLVDDLGPYGKLPTAGNAVKRLAPGRSSASRSIDGSITFPSTTWFSFLFRVNQSNMAHSAFVISSSPLNGATGPADLVSSGHAFGFNAQVNDPLVRAAIWTNNTVATVSSDALDVSTGSDIRLIVGKIEFDAGAGGNDIVTLYDVGTDLKLPEPFATVEADADQRLLNTISIHGNREYSFDEIRIGATLRDVLGLPSDTASEPNPSDQQADVPRDVALRWTPGEYADKHDVYFGTNFNDVNDADRTNPLDVLVSQNQDTTSYSLAEVLQFGQTYYWRVDEVNAPPSSTIFKGDVWQFTAEPIAYPIAGTSITATASSSNALDEGPENTINGSGLDADDLHSEANTAMWLSSTIGQQPTWIQYELDQVYKLYQMLIWNHNTTLEPVLGLGIKQAIIEYSTDGTNWTTLGTTHEFARALGEAGYAHNSTVELGGVAAKYVKITANSNWGGILPQYGLSEVRFLYIPVVAREFNPASGTTDTAVDNVTLSWRAGREAAKHNVYISDSNQAVIDETVGAVSIPANSSYGSYDTGPLDLVKSYYWKVNEVNEAETPATWQGDVLSFTTREFLVVDDFEDYNDFEPDRIFDTWIDGFGVATNGSQIGSDAPPFAEQTIVHNGSQSMALHYDNTTAGYSEATVNIANLAIGQDWTKYGIKTLSLYFYGDPNNSVTEKMYVKLNGSKVTYDSEAANIARIGWQAWNIELSSFGQATAGSAQTSVNLRNVTELSIGLERSGAVGGKGVVYFDDIRLYPYSRELVTPAEPGTAGLAGYWQFEGNANDSSGNGRHGTAVGDPAFAAGKIGQAISLDGIGDYVQITGYKGILGPNDFSITAWLRTTYIGADPQQQIVYFGTQIDGQRCEFRVHTNGRIRMGNGAGQVESFGAVTDSGWHHVAVTIVENATNSSSDVKIYVDGHDDTQESTDPDLFNIVAEWDVTIGYRPSQNDRFFIGQIDDVRIYDRVLSPEEIAWLAGRTQPFDKPF